MLFKRIAITTIAIATSLSANADDPNWTKITSNNDGVVWYIKNGSLEFTATKNETPIALVVGRVNWGKNKKINLNKWYVSAEDCAQEMGKVVTLDIGGSYLFETDFVFKAGTVASNLAEVICGIADYKIKQSSGKSL